MKTTNRQSGFSLMEVLFAMMILTLGLVFVASQFPIGLWNSRVVTDQTISAIEGNNSQMLVELKLDGMIANNILVDLALDQRINTMPPPPKYCVHLLVKPNVLADSGYGNRRLVLDDPEYYEDYIKTTFGVNPRWLFWTQVDNPYYSISYNDYTTDFVGDIGNMVSPPIYEGNLELTEHFLRLGADPLSPTPLELNKAICEASLEQNYSWCVLYRCIDRPGVSPRTFNFYVFTLRNNVKAARYALQVNSSGIVTGEALSEAIQYDRIFPVPWLIDLTVTRYAALNTAIRGAEIFRVHPEITNILRVGSTIIDHVTGLDYEVIELFVDDNGDDMVRVNKPLWSDDPTWLGMLSFWVFPPAIVDRSTNPETYADDQPVVSVRRKVVKF